MDGPQEIWIGENSVILNSRIEFGMETIIIGVCDVDGREYAALKNRFSDALTHVLYLQTLQHWWLLLPLWLHFLYCKVGHPRRPQWYHHGVFIPVAYCWVAKVIETACIVGLWRAISSSMMGGSLFMRIRGGRVEVGGMGRTGKLSLRLLNFIHLLCIGYGFLKGESFLSFYL